MKKIFLYFILIFICLQTNAKEIIFDFTVCTDGIICGQEFEQSKNLVDPFVVDDVMLQFLGKENGYEPVFFYNTYIGYFLRISNNAAMKITSTNASIYKIVIEQHEVQGLSGQWKVNGTSTRTQNYTWTGDANEVLLSEPETGNYGLYKVHVFTYDGESAVKVSNVAELSMIEDGVLVEFSQPLTSIIQSSDLKYILASDGTDMVYIKSQDVLQVVQNKQILNAGVKGRKQVYDGIVSVLVEPSSIQAQTTFEATPVLLSEINDSLIGKMVSIDYVKIADNVGEYILQQNDGQIAVNKLMIGSLPTTGVNEVASVTGVIGRVDAGYVIHPVSVVVRIFTGNEPVVSPKVDVVASGSEIKILGDWKSSKIYDINGVLVSVNKTTTECASGIYIVVVDDVNVAKVIIR